MWADWIFYECKNVCVLKKWLKPFWLSSWVAWLHFRSKVLVSFLSLPAFLLPNTSWIVRCGCLNVWGVGKFTVMLNYFFPKTCALQLMSVVTTAIFIFNSFAFCKWNQWRDDCLLAARGFCACALRALWQHFGLPSAAVLKIRLPPWFTHPACRRRGFGSHSWQQHREVRVPHSPALAPTASIASAAALASTRVGAQPRGARLGHGQQGSCEEMRALQLKEEKNINP